MLTPVKLDFATLSPMLQRGQVPPGEFGEPRWLVVATIEGEESDVPEDDRISFETVSGMVRSFDPNAQRVAVIGTDDGVPMHFADVWPPVGEVIDLDTDGLNLWAQVVGRTDGDMDRIDAMASLGMVNFSIAFLTRSNNTGGTPQLVHLALGSPGERRGTVALPMLDEQGVGLDDPQNAARTAGVKDLADLPATWYRGASPQTYGLSLRSTQQQNLTWRTPPTMKEDTEVPKPKNTTRDGAAAETATEPKDLSATIAALSEKVDGLAAQLEATESNDDDAEPDATDAPDTEPKEGNDDADDERSATKMLALLARALGLPKDEPEQTPADRIADALIRTGHAELPSDRAELVKGLSALPEAALQLLERTVQGEPERTPKGIERLRVQLPDGEQEIEVDTERVTQMHRAHGATPPDQQVVRLGALAQARSTTEDGKLDLNAYRRELQKVLEGAA